MFRGMPRAFLVAACAVSVPWTGATDAPGAWLFTDGAGAVFVAAVEPALEMPVDPVEAQCLFDGAALEWSILGDVPRSPGDDAARRARESSFWTAMGLGWIATTLLSAATPAAKPVPAAAPPPWRRRRPKRASPRKARVVGTRRPAPRDRAT